MKTHELPFFKTALSTSAFVLSLMFCTSVSHAQTPADFSGVWIQDNVKSDDFYKGFDVKCTITQIPQSISIKMAFSDKIEKKEIATHDYSFTLDGKETSKEEYGGINKELAQWSSDKKTLTTKSTRTVGSEVYGSTTTYTLSGDKLVLTVLTSDINPGGLSVKQILNKIH